MVKNLFLNIEIGLYFLSLGGKNKNTMVTHIIKLKTYGGICPSYVNAHKDGIQRPFVKL